MSELTLSVDHRVEKTSTTRTIKLDGDGIRLRCEFHIAGLGLPPPRCLDGFLIGLLFPLLSYGRPVYVDGPLTRACLRNVVELQEAWTHWKPHQYREFPITVAELIDPDLPNVKMAVCAFSGGIDGTFSVARHAKRLLGEASLPVRAAVLVHGFDVPLSKPQSFENLVHRCRPTLDTFGVELITIRTNLRESTRPTWLDAFGTQLACCLHQLDIVADAGIIASGSGYPKMAARDHAPALSSLQRLEVSGKTGSDEPYSQLYFPLGSTPATDHLLSGGMFSIFHDGAAHSRTAKVQQLAAFPEVIKTLKVCFAGPNPEENCGACEKCLRTYLNFRASGIDHPECMPIPSLEQLANIPLPTQLQANEIREALDYARKHGRSGAWLQAAEKSVASFDKGIRAASVRSAIKRIPYVGPLLRAANRSWRAFGSGKAA